MCLVAGMLSAFGRIGDLMSLSAPYYVQHLQQDVIVQRPESLWHDLVDSHKNDWPRGLLAARLLRCT